MIQVSGALGSARYSEPVTIFDIGGDYNMSKEKKPTPAEAVAEAVYVLNHECDCDGRGCTLCIAADKLEDALTRQRAGERIGWA